MRPENAKMQEYLNQHGIKATPKFLREGSLKGTWRLYYKARGKSHSLENYTKWNENYELMGKLHALGFRDFDGEPFNDFSGNGGVFSVFARVPKEVTEQCIT
jgi:hypothetical protein